MSHYRNHQHINGAGRNFRPAGGGSAYAAVVGTVDTSTEKPITGRNGDHLQFYIQTGGGDRYQVDVNTQSRDGTDVYIFMAAEDIKPAGGPVNPPFGPPTYGVFTDAALSYKGLGLKPTQFADESDMRIEQQLEAALSQAEFVTAYGSTFDDGGNDGKGVHLIHYTGQQNKDGALAVYTKDPDTSTPKCTWFFFKFNEDSF
jgi:hypothetical protein